MNETQQQQQLEVLQILHDFFTYIKKRINKYQTINNQNIREIVWKRQLLALSSSSFEAFFWRIVRHFQLIFKPFRNDSKRFSANGVDKNNNNKKKDADVVTQRGRNRLRNVTPATERGHRRGRRYVPVTKRRHVPVQLLHSFCGVDILWNVLEPPPVIWYVAAYRLPLTPILDKMAPTFPHFPPFSTIFKPFLMISQNVAHHSFWKAFTQPSIQLPATASFAYVACIIFKSHIVHLIPFWRDTYNGCSHFRPLSTFDFFPIWSWQIGGHLAAPPWTSDVTRHVIKHLFSIYHAHLTDYWLDTKFF